VLQPQLLVQRVLQHVLYEPHRVKPHALPAAAVSIYDGSIATIDVPAGNASVLTIHSYAMKVRTSNVD